jgi:hypothetical protein
MEACKDKALRAIAMNERCLPAFGTLCNAHFQELIKLWTNTKVR